MDASQAPTEVSMQTSGVENAAFSKDGSEYDVNMNTTTGATASRRPMSVEEMLRRPSIAVNNRNNTSRVTAKVFKLCDFAAVKQWRVGQRETGSSSHSFQP